MLYLSLSFYLRLISWSHLFHIRKSQVTLYHTIFDFRKPILSNIPPGHRGRKEWPLTKVADAIITTTSKKKQGWSRIHLKLNSLFQNAPFTLSNEAFELLLVGWRLEESKDSQLIGESCRLFKEHRWEIVAIVCWEQSSKCFSRDRSSVKRIKSKGNRNSEGFWALFI